MSVDHVAERMFAIRPAGAMQHGRSSLLNDSVALGDDRRGIGQHPLNRDPGFLRHLFGARALAQPGLHLLRSQRTFGTPLRSCRGQLAANGGAQLIIEAKPVTRLTRALTEQKGLAVVADADNLQLAHRLSHR